MHIMIIICQEDQLTIMDFLRGSEYIFSIFSNSGFLSQRANYALKLLIILMFQKVIRKNS